ncbi:hypothetical protein SSX86_005854 [Deinandra increscens subsp. villosa]|uniref:Uncharacterized protein n=1 Tax=Deinandra increscens subsp. villosa TaxID=3103831 RepID=A0AAP0HAG3_9ASTR
MGFWDAVYYTGDLVNRNTPDMVKRAGVAAYHCTSSAVTKIDQVVRVDGIQKLPQYWPNDETKSLIVPFTVTLAKNAGKYAVYEGFKHIPGATVASKLVSDSMREVKQNNHKERMKAVEEKVDKFEKDLIKSTSQLEILVQNEKLSFENAVEGGCEKTKDMTTTFMKTDLIQNDKLCFENAVKGGPEKAKDVINTFMKNEFVGNHMFHDLMVPRFVRIENANE